MEHDTEPEKSEDRELIEKQRRHHGLAPLHGGVMGGLYRVLGLKQLSAARRYTASSGSFTKLREAGSIDIVDVRGTLAGANVLLFQLIGEKTRRSQHDEH
jgi:hypothetical protein